MPTRITQQIQIGVLRYALFWVNHTWNIFLRISVYEVSTLTFVTVFQSEEEVYTNLILHPANVTASKQAPLEWGHFKYAYSPAQTIKH